MPSLEITTMVGCPLMCTFCPQQELKSRYGDRVKYMTVETFRKILEHTPRHVRIDFSGMSEPWANPDATEMLWWSLIDGRTIAIYTTLVGMKEPWHVAGLLRQRAAQVEKIVVHLPDAAGNMRGFKISNEWVDALDAFIHLSRESSIAVSMMTMDGGGEVHPDVVKMVRRVDAWVGNRRAGSLDASEVAGPIEAELENAGAVACSFTPFLDQNVVLPNGDVVLCCMDYSLKHKIGNLVADDYYNMFAAAELGRIRSANMDPDNRSTICRKCTRATKLVQGTTKQFWEAA